jgi:hypothetical protein
MSDALAQLPEAIAAASALLTVYFLGRREHSKARPRRRLSHGANVKRN